MASVPGDEPATCTPVASIRSANSGPDRSIITTVFVTRRPTASKAPIQTAGGGSTSAIPSLNFVAGAQGCLDSTNTCCGPQFQRMLPNPQHPPSPAAQLARHPTVALPIPQHFRIPKPPVRFGPSITARTPMPETPVHKQRQAFRPEHKIRFAKHLLVPPPSGDVVMPQHCHQSQLGALVATPANQQHDRGAFRLGEHVSHCRTPANGRLPLAAAHSHPTPTLQSGRTDHAKARRRQHDGGHESDRRPPH